MLHAQRVLPLTSRDGAALAVGAPRKLEGSRLQQRARAAEKQVGLLNGQLSDAQADAMRLLHKLEETQAQLLARDAKIAALTRRQLLAATGARGEDRGGE